MGYSQNVSYYLAGLCCFKGALPQGAPTSPVLSNIVSRSLDKRLFKLAKKLSLRYSRYADDISFSGEFIPRNFLKLVRKIVEEQGFALNDDKTKLMVGSNRKVVTGINVANENLSLSKKYKRELKKEAYFIGKYGLKSHLVKRKIRDPKYLAKLEGKARYWVNVEEWNEEARSILSVFSSHNVKIN